MTTTELRPELTELPEKMKHLRADKRGYPVPAFVEWVNDEPDFRIMRRQHWVDCVARRLCWVCGLKLGVSLVFPIGPMCAVNRTTSEPPCHRECAIWSVKNCPFLSRPHMVRREDDLTREAEKNVAGIMIRRNPGPVCVWTTKGYKVWRDDKGAPLIRIGGPVRVEWFAQGRPATRDEVEESIRTGLPALEEIVRMQTGALEHLHKAVAGVMKLLPAV